MNWLFERKLKRLGEKANPDPVFVRNLEKRLKTELGHPAWWVQGWKWATGGVTALTVIASATGAYAYTSDAVTPVHPLYGVRQALEHVEERLAVTPEAKLNVAVKHLNRRLKEDALLHEKEGTVEKERYENVNTRLETLLDESERLPENARGSVEDAIDELEANHERNLQEVRERAKTEKEKTDLEAIIKREHEQVRKKVQKIREKRTIHIPTGTTR